MSDREDLSPVVEALIFAARSPVSAAQLRRGVPWLTASRLAEMVEEINQALEHDGRPYRISEVAGGYQFRTRPEFADRIRAMQPERKLRLSRAALETVAVIAYRQPITRAEIEDLRCVDCGAVLRSLLDRALIRIVGRRDAPGRPVLYGTSATFLETFDLASLRDLPELRDIEDLGARDGTPVERLAGVLATPPGEDSCEAPEHGDTAVRAAAPPGAGEGLGPEHDAGEPAGDEIAEPGNGAP